MRKPFDPPESPSDYPLSRWAMVHPVQCGVLSAVMIGSWASVLWGRLAISAIIALAMFVLQFSLWRRGGYLHRRTADLFSRFESAP